MSFEGQQREIVDFTVSFERFAPALVDDAVARQREQLPEFLTVSADADPVVRDAAAVGVAVALSAIRAPERSLAAPPAASAREARLAAREGVPSAALAQSYRIGHAAFQDHVLRHAERTGTSPGVMRAVARSLFRHVDWLLPLAEREFAAERRRLEQLPDRARYDRVRRVLAGQPDDGLGHPVDGLHVALVTRGGGDDDVGAAVARALGTTALSVRTPEGDGWAWLAADGLDDAAIRAALGRVVPRGMTGVSGPAAGLAGFAAAHHDAALALRVGAARRARVTHHVDVALEALAFGGPDAARAFSRAELGPLAGDDDRVAVLRDTVRVYFEQGSSTPAAARALGIAERTVTYRLRRAEQLAGRPVTVRRTELETALRLHRLFAVGG